MLRLLYIQLQQALEKDIRVLVTLLINDIFHSFSFEPIMVRVKRVNKISFEGK